MSTDELLKILQDRGLEVVFDGRTPRIHGKRSELTPALVRVLKHHREEIIRRLAPPPLREWLWRSGLKYTCLPYDEHCKRRENHPVGAGWWRWEGEIGWRRVPGRSTDWVLPEGEVEAAEG